MHYVLTAIALLLEHGWLVGPVPPPEPVDAVAPTSLAVASPARAATSRVPALTTSVAMIAASEAIDASDGSDADVDRPLRDVSVAAASLGFGPLIDVPVAPALLAQTATPAGKLSASDVVAKVQAFYKATDRLTADFRQYYTNTTFGKKTKSDGRVYIRKPGKMRWDYHEKSRGKVKQVKSFVSDGNMLWAVEHDNKQAFKQELGDNVLPVAVTFLHGTGNLNKDFNARLDSSGKYGRKGDLVLELTPKTPSAQYKTLWLVVDPGNFRVKESIVLEASGNTNRFAFYRPNLEKEIKDSWFAVDEKALRKARYRIIEPAKQK